MRRAARMTELSPRHTGRRPRCDHGDLGNPPDRRVVAGYQKNAPLCDCNKDRAALSRRSGARLCEPNCASTATSASVRRSYHDLTAPRTRVQCDHRRPYSDATAT